MSHGVSIATLVEAWDTMMNDPSKINLMQYQKLSKGEYSEAYKSACDYTDDDALAVVHQRRLLSFKYATDAQKLESLEWLRAYWMAGGQR
jgi:hypothetical protein